MDYLEPLKKKPLEEGENRLALCGEIYKLGAGAERVKQWVYALHFYHTSERLTADRQKKKFRMSI